VTTKLRTATKEIAGKLERETMKGIAVALLALIVGGTSAALAQKTDIRGSSDHPLVGRYQGSVITAFERKAYEEISLPDRPMARGNAKAPETWRKPVAGKLTAFRYEGPGERSLLEVMRNHEQALRAKGFEITLFCRTKDCAVTDVSTFWTAGRGPVGLPPTWESLIYLLAERNDAQGVVTVAMLGVETKASGSTPLTPHLAVTIVEGKPMDSGKIAVVKSDEMQQKLARDGRVAIYGIYFDFDKAEIKAQSREQIEQLGMLMKNNPKLDVLIVGHTDAQGAFDYNLSLSQRRAQAVAQALAADFGIAARRVTAAGAGMMAPVASNRSEDGRVKNRRVEIVERVAAN